VHFPRGYQRKPSNGETIIGPGWFAHFLRPNEKNVMALIRMTPVMTKKQLFARRCFPGIPVAVPS
jgi:hypothetical protein